MNIQVQVNTLKRLIAKTRFNVNIPDDAVIILKANRGSHSANKIPVLNRAKSSEYLLPNVRKSGSFRVLFVRHFDVVSERPNATRWFVCEIDGTRDQLGKIREPIFGGIFLPDS